MEPIATVALVMLTAGVLGGTMNFYITSYENSNTMPWWQHVVLGVGASYMVPLFLNMISSSLIKEIIGPSPATPGDSSKLFVLAGFSLVAAVSARAFIRSLSDRVLQDVREAKHEAEKAQAAAQQAQTQASTALSVLDENDTTEVGNKDSALLGDGNATLNEEELRVILEMTGGRYSMRSISGLAADTDLPMEAVNTAISSLMEKGLIEQGTNSRGERRWFPSPSGRIIATRARNSNVTPASTDNTGI